MLFLLFGLGANGKSTFLSAVRSLLGDYGTTTDIATWMARDRHINNDIAALRGSRLVIASETEDGSRFAEVLLKLATGGDTLKARFLYAEYFEFRPQFKLWIAGEPQTRDPRRRSRNLAAHSACTVHRDGAG